MWSNQEIIFAQKATAIVKAASMDPRLLDLDQFRLLSPIIFTRAFCAIYKEHEFTLDTDSSKEDVILVSQLVIDGLVAKTRNPALSLITGFDVYQRNHRAIGILVGILFDEGQRLWIEKRGTINDRNAHSPKKELQDSNSPREIRKLLNKIDNLEGQLKKSKNHRDDEVQHHIKQDNLNSSLDQPETEGNEISYDPPEPPVHRRPLSASKAQSDSNVLHRANRPSSAGTTRVVQQLRKGASFNSHNDHFSLPVPPSQPPKSPDRIKKQSSSLSNQQQYTYDMKSGRKIPLKQASNNTHQNVMTNLDQLQFNQNKQIIHESLKGNEQQANNNIFKPILPSKPEYPCKRIEKSVEEWLKKMQELDKYAADPSYQSSLLNPMANNSNPVIVHHPSYTLMEENDLIISVEHCHDCSHHNISLRHDPKEYQEKALKFVKQLANEIFNGNYCVRLGICVVPAILKHNHKGGNELETASNRIGAFEVQIAYKSPISKDIEIDILYSKLQTRRWPSKSVIEKRLNSFISKNHIPVMKPSMCEHIDFEMKMDDGYSYPKGKCEWENVSIANPSWSFTFQPSNMFLELLFDFSELAPKDNRRVQTTNIAATSSAVPKTNPSAEKKKEDVSSPTVKLNQPDPELVNHQPTFAIGQKVWVQNMVYMKDCIEPLPLLAVVKNVILHNDYDDYIHYKIQPNYYHDEIEVKESDLFPFETFQLEPVKVNFDPEELPCPVELLHFFSILEKHSLYSLFWNFPEKGDQENVVSGQPEYSRKSIFLLFRQVIWESLHYFKNKGNLSDFQQLFSDVSQSVNLHALYSEKILDYIFYSLSNEAINKKEFVNRGYLIELPHKVLNRYRLSVSPKENIERDSISTVEQPVRTENQTPPAPIPDPVVKTDSPVKSAAIIENFPPESTSNPNSSSEVPLLVETSKSANEEKTVVSPPAENTSVASTTENPVQKEKPEPFATEVQLSSSPELKPESSSTSEMIPEPLVAVELPSTFVSQSAQDSPSQQQPPVQKAPAAEVPAAQEPAKISPRQTVSIPQEFENKDIVISSIILEGNVLSHEVYDTIFVTFIYETHQKQATVCLAREKGSKRRSFNVHWDEIPMTSIAFKQSVQDLDKASVNIVLSVSNKELLSLHPNLPVLESTDPGKSLNSCKLSLLEFYKDSFEIKCEVTLPNYHPPSSIVPVTPKDPATPGSPRASISSPRDNPLSGKVTITINGHAHEARENRRSRIMSMKPVELLTLKFEPLPVDDDYSDDELDNSDDEKEKKKPTKQPAKLHPGPKSNTVISSNPGNLSARKSQMTHLEGAIIEEGDENDEMMETVGKLPDGKIPPLKETDQGDSLYENSFEHDEEEELKNTLFPKASIYNLLTK